MKHLQIVAYLHTHMYKCIFYHNIKYVSSCGSQFKNFGMHYTRAYLQGDRDKLVE